MPTTIQAEGLWKWFGEPPRQTVALQDVSLDVAAGGITTLMGPSGSGKSTLLASLSGLLRPERGTVTLLGQRLWNLSEVERERFRRQHCGFIFQQYNLFPALTACQQLEIALQWGSDLPASQVRRQAKETLADLGLGDKLHLRPHQLSGGEKQRVAVARALAKRPALIFADEPTAALDWAHGSQVIDMLRQVASSQGATVLLVSHDPRIIPRTDRMLCLEDGKLLEPGEDSGQEL